MDLRHIDYISVTGRSWLHRLPAWTKLLFLMLVLVTALIWPYPVITGSMLLLVLLMMMSAQLPFVMVLSLLMYPLLFLLMLFISIDHPQPLALLAVLLRVLVITSTAVMVLLTTSYPRIFSALQRVLPGGFVAALFFSYRAIFILSDGLNNMQTALHLRGGIDKRHPIASLRNLGLSLGHFLIHAIEASQRIGDNLVIRGFNNKVYSRGSKQ